MWAVREPLITKKDWLVATTTTRTVVSRVWIDVGTAWRSLASWDVEHNSTLVVVGVDALRANLDDVRQPVSPRFIRVHGACSTSGGENITFFKHASPTCGSLLATVPGGPKLGAGADACVGDVPRRLSVRAFRLATLLHRVRALGIFRVELLKLDIQGSELDCLESATPELAMVDNILLEVQDVGDSSQLHVYKGSASLRAIEPFLKRRGFLNQYCEWNRWGKSVREVNCLFTRTTGRPVWMWATGNSRPGRSMVSYGIERPKDLDVVRKLWTSETGGIRV